MKLGHIWILGVGILRNVLQPRADSVGNIARHRAESFVSALGEQDPVHSANISIVLTILSNRRSFVDGTSKMRVRVTERGGPEFGNAVLGPTPRTRMTPTSGVEATEDSIRA